MPNDTKHYSAIRGVSSLDWWNKERYAIEPCNRWVKRIDRCFFAWEDRAINGDVLASGKCNFDALPAQFTSSFLYDGDKAGNYSDWFLVPKP